MILLLIGFVLIIIGNSVRNSSSLDKPKSQIIIYTVLLVILSTIRHPGITADGVSYISEYVEVNQTSWGELLKDARLGAKRDPYFDLLLKLFTFISPSYYFFYFIVAFLFLGSFGKMVYNYLKDTNEIILAYLLYLNYFFIIYPNAAMRQSIAFSIVLFIFDWIKEHKKTSRCVLLIILASFIHRSVLFTLLFIPISYIKNPKYYKYAILLLPLFFIFINNVIFGYLLQFSMLEQYQYFGDYAGTFEPPVFLLVQILFFYFLIWIVDIRRKILEKNLFFCCLFAFSVLLISAVFVDPSFLRLVHYFMILMCICIPIVVKSEKKVIKHLFVIALLARLFFFASDYKFIWQQVQLHERYRYNMEYYLQ